jgi:hypothetical protein
MSVTTGVFGRKDNVMWLVGVATLAAEPGHGCNWGGCRLETRNSCRAGFIVPMQGSCSGLRQMATGFDNVWMSKGEHTPKESYLCLPCSSTQQQKQLSTVLLGHGHRSPFHPSKMLGQRTVFWSSHESGAVAELHNTLRIPDWTAPDQSQRQLRAS